jgi:hypothetical protein
MAITVIKGNGIKTTLKGAFFDDILLGWGVTQVLGGFADANINLAETMYGGGGADTIYGGGGADVLYGEAGSDWLYGGTGADKLYGGAAADHLFGGDGGDTVDGGDGADELQGEAGNDTLLGGAGNDTLTGGLGNDSLNGGNGDNDLAIFDCSAQDATFAYEPYGGRLTVTSPEGVDIVANVEWLQFNPGEIWEPPIPEGNFAPQNRPAPDPAPEPEVFSKQGVFAKDDVATANAAWDGAVLNLSAADLLANDFSFKPGAPLDYVFLRGGWVAFTDDEWIPVFINDEGQVVLDSSFSWLEPGQQYQTSFHYEVGNGTGATDYGRVDVTIIGQELVK